MRLVPHHKRRAEDLIELRLVALVWADCDVLRVVPLHELGFAFYHLIDTADLVAHFPAYFKNSLRSIREGCHENITILMTTMPMMIPIVRPKKKSVAKWPCVVALRAMLGSIQ